MPSSTTLRPDGVISSSGSITPTGGTNTAVVVDNSDATYIAMNDATIQYSFADFSFPAGATIQSVTIRVRCQVANFTGGQYAFTAGVGPNIGQTGPWLTPVNMSAQTFQCPTMTVRPDGQAWTATDVNNLYLICQNGGNTGWTGPDGWIYEIYADVIYNTVPVVVGTGPNATVNTTRPTFTWSYTDDDLQERWRIKVFDADQIAAAGFNPNTSTPLIDTGEQFGSTTTWTPSTDIANGKTVRAYLWVSDTGSYGRYNTVTTSGPYAYCTIDLAPTSQSQPNMPRIGDTSYASGVTKYDDIKAFQIDLWDTQNMLDSNQADAETALSGWTPGAGVTATVVRDIAAAGNHGLARYKITASAGGTNALILAGASGLLNGTRISGSTPISAQAWFKAAATVRNCFVSLYWYDSVGAFISKNDGPAVNNSTSTWVPAFVTATPPGNATRCLVAVTVSGMANAEIQYFDTISIIPGLMNQLANPIFETSGGGNSSGVGVIAAQWTNTNTVAPTTQVYSIDTSVYYAGERSQKLEWSGGTAAGLIGIATFNYHPILTTGTRYQVDAMVKCLATTDFTISCPAQSWTQTITVQPGDWYRLNTGGVAVASGSSPIFITAKGASGTVWFGQAGIVILPSIFSDSSGPKLGTYLVWSGGGMISNARFQLQRSVDGGLTWTTVIRGPWKNAYAAPFSAYNTTDYQSIDYDDSTQGISVWDFEVPYGVTPRYRVRTVTTIGSNVIASQWSPITPNMGALTVPSYRWMIQCPFNPALNWYFDFEGPTWERTNSEEAAFFGPIGRPRSVRVADTIRGDKFELTAMLPTWTDIDKMQAIRRTQQPVLLRDPIGRQWWVAFGPDEVIDEQVMSARTDTTPPYQKITYTFEEVDAPTY